MSAFLIGLAAYALVCLLVSWSGRNAKARHRAERERDRKDGRRG